MPIFWSTKALNYFQLPSSQGFLPSAASVVRALSPLLTPAFVAANSMTQRAYKIRQNYNQEQQAQSPIEDDYVQLKLGPKELPFMTQVSYNSYLIAVGFQKPIVTFFYAFNFNSLSLLLLKASIVCPPVAFRHKFTKVSERLLPDSLLTFGVFINAHLAQSQQLIWSRCSLLLTKIFRGNFKRYIFSVKWARVSFRSFSVKSIRFGVFFLGQK